MKKRAAAGRISDTKKKKEIERKIKTALRTPEKTVEKKKRKIAPKPAGKTRARKVKVEGEKKVKGKEKQKTVRNKISPKPEKKIEKIKAEGKSKKRITKTQVSAKEKAGKVARATRRTRKSEEKAPLKRREKVPPKAAGKVRIRKTLAAKTAQKIKARVATKAEIETREDNTSRQLVKKEIVSRKVAEVVAGPPTPRAVLPEEYGENSVTLMTVDPYRLFAFWEVREETLEIFRGEVDIRVYDVTGIDFDRMDANTYLDVRADGRIGKCYVSVNPEREYTADIGIIFDGIFIAIARSARVSTPCAAVSEEGILLSGLGETGLRTGY